MGEPARDDELRIEVVVQGQHPGHRPAQNTNLKTALPIGQTDEIHSAAPGHARSPLSRRLSPSCTRISTRPRRGIA
ncbi:hypothetical protein GCM10019017_76800 [Streptomyces showdoensis]